MGESGRFKKKKAYFSQVSNTALRDNTLSLKAKGLYALIQSYITLEDFILYKTTLKKQCIEGKTSFGCAWKELKDKGYLLQERHSTEEGKFYYEYELLDVAIPTKTGTPKTVYRKTRYTDKPVPGKPGVYTNTDLTNTDTNNTPSNNTDTTNNKEGERDFSYYEELKKRILSQ